MRFHLAMTMTSFCIVDFNLKIVFYPERCMVTGKPLDCDCGLKQAGDLFT